jgi:hypothetical protein
MISLSFPEYISGPAYAKAQNAHRMVRIKVNFLIAQASIQAAKHRQPPILLEKKAGC